MELHASVGYNSEPCSSSTNNATVAAATLDLTVGGTIVSVSEAEIHYFRCAKPMPIMKLKGKIASLVLPGDVVFTDISLSIDRKADGEWQGSLLGSVNYDGLVVSTIAQFSSVGGLQALGLNGMLHYYS